MRKIGRTLFHIETAEQSILLNGSCGANGTQTQYVVRCSGPKGRELGRFAIYDQAVRYVIAVKTTYALVGRRN